MKKWYQHGAVYSFLAITMTIALVLSMGAGALVPQNASAAPSTNVTLWGFHANQTGSGSLKLGWGGGNMGNTWAEGEWVPYQFIMENVQANYPSLAGLPDIIISYDFTKKGVRFVDLVRGLQVGTTPLTDSEGWPMDDHTAYSMITRTELEDAQNDVGNTPPLDNNWTGFQLLNLPPSQVHRSLTLGDLTVTDDRAVFQITPTDLTGAGISTSADTIVVYWQLHESRTFIWNNDLQEGYDAPPTDDWGGYVYSTGTFPDDVRDGSSYVPGSSGHAHLETFSGSQDVPIPIPAGLPGSVSGMKWRDDNANGIMDGVEPPLSGWRIYVEGTVEEISFSTSTLTDGSGNYSFPGLSSGTTWTIKEDSQREDPAETGYVQTYPDVGVIVGQGEGVSVSPPPAGVAPVGWEVELTIDNPDQADMDFGNFQPEPDLDITKTADTLSKVGDEVNYTFVITNTGNIDLDRDSVIDTVLGDITLDFPATLAPDESVEVNLSRVVVEGDPDPLENTVTATYTVTILATDVIATDTHSVDLVHPGIDITKVADTDISKVDDTITYTITVENTGDVTLENVVVNDPMLGGDLTEFSSTFTAGQLESFDYDYTVVAGDEPGPVLNTVTVISNPVDLTNEISDEASASVDLVHPDYTLTKSADPTSATVGATITYTMVITNTGDVQLNRVSVNDTLMGDITADFPATLALSQSVTVIKTRDIQPSDPNPLVNVVTAVYQVDGLPNQLTREADASVEVFKEFRKEFTDPHVLVGTVWVTLEQWHIDNDTAGATWVPVGEQIKWTVTYYVPSESGEDWTDVVLRDRFGAELDHADANGVDPDEYGYTMIGPTVDVTFEYSKAQKMPQLRLIWDIGDLSDGQTATLSFDVVTRLNPGKNKNFPDGHQEFTSPGLHILNSGAVLKWKVDGVQDSMSTPPCYVMVGDTYGAIVGFVTDSAGDPATDRKVQISWDMSTDTRVPDGEHGFYYFGTQDPNYYEVCLLDLSDILVSGSCTGLLELDGGEIIIVNYVNDVPDIP